MSNNSHFEKGYFDGDQSIFWKIGGYELLTRLNRWRLKKFKKIIKNYATINHKTLLDIGCAYGHFLELLRDDFVIYGTDISQHATNVTKCRLKCPVKQGDIEKNCLFDKNFDIITALDVLEHLNDPKKAIKNIYDLLNDDGIFCFQLPTVNNALSKIINRLFFAWDKTHVFITNIEEIEKMIKSVGFEKIAIYSSLFPIFTKKVKFVEDFCMIFGIFKKV